MSKQRFCAPVKVESVNCVSTPSAPIVEEKVYKECRPATQCRQIKETKVIEKSDFACEEAEVCEVKKKEDCDPCASKGKKKRKGWQGFLMWLVISLIIGIILWITLPPLVTRVDDFSGQSCINWWALIVASLVFGAIILGIIWLISYLVGKKRQY